MEPSDSLQSQFDAAKSEVPVGWHWMLDILAQEIKTRQGEWLKLNGNGQQKFAKSDKPVFDFVLSQAKSKFSEIRIYSHIEKVDHDWNFFNKDSYDERFDRINSEIAGMISILGYISGNISEESGERGKIRNINGWLTCLTDEEYAKVS